MSGSNAFERIQQYFNEFCSAVERCQHSTAISEDLKNAYGAFGRLRERYKEEKPNLNKEERSVLSKVFEDDTFIEGIGKIRTVSEHVEIKDFTIRTTHNETVSLAVGSSAMAVFPAPIVNLPTIAGGVHRLNHLEMLTEARKRIQKAITKAKG